MRILGSVVIKDEADRYLSPCLEWAHSFLDEIFVYDDQSTDDSVEIAERIGCDVTVRKDDVPSFLEHESQFRQDAWHNFVERLDPEVGDWIISFDADEFLVSNSGSPVRDALELAIKKADQDNTIGIVVPFQEIFKIDEEGFWKRVDGLWKTVRGPRFFRYLDVPAEWSGKPMGSGSEPLYVVEGKKSTFVPDLSFLHLGYAKQEDQVKKHERYTSLYDHGHNNKHIQSIVQKPKLELWHGGTPEVEL